MNSLTTTQTNDLVSQLTSLGLKVTAGSLDDFIARATTARWSPRLLLEELVRAETMDKAHRSLERRQRRAKIGRFKPMADFEWTWPTRIDRPLIERALTLDFISEARNLILLGANGLGKTMIIQNIAYQALLAGHTVLFRTAADLVADLHCDSPQQHRRNIASYSRPRLLCIDEVGYLSYDSVAADLLYEVVNRRYERSSIVMSTNRSFRDWNTVFPNATSIATLLDRLTHHADLTVIEGQSYRVRESELEAAARKQRLSAPI
jgi:DNA replication protein DnaC